MTRGVKIFNKQNYLEDSVCEKHFILQFCPWSFNFLGGEVLIFERFPVCSVNYKEKFFFSVRISFFKIVLLAFTYRLVSKVYLTEQYGENGYLILSAQ